MADLSDVETAIKSLIVNWVYPTGTAQPSAVPGAPPIKVARGWPTATELKADLGHVPPIAFVSIYSAPGSERQTTRYPREWQTLTPATPTITATVSPGQVTLGGTMSTPQLVAVLAYGQPFVYAVQPGDTLAIIAAALATMVSAAGEATSDGAVLTIPSPLLGARVGGYGQVIRELRRQERLIQITIWTATPELRDTISSFLDAKLAGAGSPNGLDFIALVDGTAARIQYARTAPTDQDQLSGLFRRDLIYSVEYATTETMSVPQVVVFQTQWSANGGPYLTVNNIGQVVRLPAALGSQLDFAIPANSPLIAAAL